MILHTNKHAVTALNSLFKLDPKAVQELITSKVICNDAIGEEVNVSQEKDSSGNSILTVSVLSLLNEVMVSLGYSKIAAVFVEDGSSTGTLEKFISYDDAGAYTAEEECDGCGCGCSSGCGDDANGC